MEITGVHPMGENVYVTCEVPTAAIDLMMTAWSDFKRKPSDPDLFKVFDWVVNVAFRKWQMYAENRRVRGV